MLQQRERERDVKGKFVMLEKVDGMKLVKDGLKLGKECKDVSFFHVWSFAAQAIKNPKFGRFLMILAL